MTTIGGLGLPGGGMGAFSGTGMPGGGGNPLGGLAGQNGVGSSLSGMGDMGIGGDSTDGSTGTGGGGGGLAPINAPTSAQGASFGDTLKSLVLEGPSATKAQASNLAARFAAGDTSIDPHQIAIANAQAGVEIQMSTRTISSAVSAVRTLFQMQI